MTFARYVNDIINLLSTVVVPTIFALSFLVFVWGVVSYFFFGVNDEKKRAEGRTFAFWGILGMVVLFSVWGLVNIVLSTLGIAPAA